MKVKKIGIISFLLIINILILSHIIVPHHHHDNIPCFTADMTHSGCTHDDPAQEEHENNCCNHHNHSEKEGSCVLDEFVIIHDLNQKTDHQCPDCFHSHDPNLLQAVLFIINYDLSIPEDSRILRQPPYLISYHSDFVSQNLGLRAPPFLNI